MYQIATQDELGQWVPEHVGNHDANQFETVEDAREGITELRKLGREWLIADYAIVASDGEVVEIRKWVEPID